MSAEHADESAEHDGVTCLHGTVTNGAVYLRDGETDHFAEALWEGRYIRTDSVVHLEDAR